MTFNRKYSWESLIQEGQLQERNNTSSIYDEVVKLFSESSAEDRAKILEIFKGLVGAEYAKKMVASDAIETFKNITSSFEESTLIEIRNIMQTAKTKHKKNKVTNLKNRNDEYDYHSAVDDLEDEEYGGIDDLDDEAVERRLKKDMTHEKQKNRLEKKKQQHRASSFLNELIKQAAENETSLQSVLAAWEEKDRKALFDEFVGLLGSAYTKDMVRDHKPRGKARDVSSPQSSGQLEEKGDTSVDGSLTEEKDSSTTDANSKKSVKTASKDDRNQVEKLFSGLLGANFAKKLVEEYKTKGKTSTKKTSGQTKTSSFDPWGLNKEAKEKPKSKKK